MIKIKDIIKEFPNHNYQEIQTVLMYEILVTLKAMKQQEFDYWEAWKKAKTKETESK